jgi:uncharacterized protein YdaU (DUF1376 family)
MAGGQRAAGGEGGGVSRAWMPLYIGDYLADTMHLSIEEHGAYLLLIMHYWQNGGLPKDNLSLRKIVGVNGYKWRWIRQAIAPFFDDEWRHKRIDRELEKAKQISEKRQVSGRIGGLKSSGRTNMSRIVHQAIGEQVLKQTGHQSHKRYITSSEQVAEPKATKKEASPSLISAMKSKGWVL